MINLEDKVIWITGASSGIGEELSYQLSEKGAILILSSRREAELQRVKEACKGKNSDKIKVLPLDLAEADELPSKAEEALSYHGYIDILINNGGISHRATVLESDMSVYRRIMEIDYFAQIQLSKLVLPSMLEGGFGQHLVLTSATGIISTPLRSAYAAAKHALHGFYDAMHAENFDDNVRVTLVCPGYIKTNVSYNALNAKGESQKKHDLDIQKGMSPKKAVSKIIRALEKRKAEVYFGGMKEMLGIYLKRFVPAVYAVAVRKQDYSD